MTLSAPLRQLRVSDGTRLAYRLYGPHLYADPQPSLGRIVLCDGISCDGYIWRDLLPALARHYDILHFNYRGHGRSGLPRDLNRVTVPILAQDLNALLHELKWDEATLIAHSMGVQVALETALRHPSRVKALVLCCGSYGRLLDSFRNSDVGTKVLPLIDAVTVTWREAVSSAVRAVMPSSFSYVLAALTEIKAEHISQHDLQPYLDHFARMPLDLFTTLLMDASERTAEPFLARIYQPTLVLAAQDDGFTPLSSSEKLVSLLAHARLEVVPDTSHTAPLEAPQAFEHAISRFLEELNEHRSENRDHTRPFFGAA